MSDPFSNSKDPLLKAGPEQQVVLLRAYAQMATGWPVHEVNAVAMSLVVNSLRQTCKTSLQAEHQYNELVGRFKSALLEHYDANGRRRGIFPYDQVITPRGG